jgi:hypothetical protein
LLLTDTEKALAGMVILAGFAAGFPVHVPVEILDVVQEHGSLKIEEDMDGCFDVTLELDGLEREV